MPKFWQHHRYEQQWFYRFTTSLLMGGQVLVRLKNLRRLTLMEQMASVGFGSLFVVLLTNGFTGMLFVLQTARELDKFGATSIVGAAFALGYCRELAPILTAGLLVGEVSSAFAAELGEMRVTDQIDALYMLQTNPIDYLVLPRVVACCVMLPVLTMLAIPVAILGGVVAAAHLYTLEPAQFLRSFQEALSIYDLINILIKAMIFGVITALTGCGWGLTTYGGAKGVSKATKAAVVNGWIFVFFANFVLTLLMYGSKA
jgi:phospholipid/cholesterol/gamma-HCH transport system permease protein